MSGALKPIQGSERPRKKPLRDRGGRALVSVLSALLGVFFFPTNS